MLRMHGIEQAAGPGELRGTRVADELDSRPRPAGAQKAQRRQCDEEVAESAAAENQNLNEQYLPLTSGHATLLELNKSEI
jgi:hypothetical protein